MALDKRPKYFFDLMTKQTEYKYGYDIFNDTFFHNILSDMSTHVPINQKLFKNITLLKSHVRIIEIKTSKVLLIVSYRFT